MNLPDVFVWSKIGQESGEDISLIFRRKEMERVSTGGVFFWGIGVSLGEKVRNVTSPKVFFSHIKTKARREDAYPCQIVVWESYFHDGGTYKIPDNILVISKMPKRNQYALICRRDTPLEYGCFGNIYHHDLRNFQRGTRIGGSQVSAVVQQANQETDRDYYPICSYADLVYPYCVKLMDYRIITEPIKYPSTEGWISFCKTLRQSS